MELLLLSNSTAPGRAFLDHAREPLSALFADRPDVLFVPYANADHDGYTATVRAALEPMGAAVRGVHRAESPAEAVRGAAAVFVGGGNTFRLLDALWTFGLVEPLRAAVAAGTAYIGSSAGTNMAGPSLRTTNDMPIAQPPTFEALGLVPFQLNPHYLDPDPGSTHMGETREQRITEFLERNDVPVLGLREGGWLRVSGTPGEGRRALLAGDHPARLFTRASAPREYPSGADLSFLLDTVPRFDVGS
ncbi:alpha-aspartyl dipeptidase [Murinocardiopsis flavida]|uniref:dipeptidase E n=1 Tax=Murinocardiopsis flavida TaxID=645275 RepID=A0A2P8DTQ5_9ACTN|nr:dipeptidase PepE [Murinocardiopsis flavida]PSL00594.1 alpha-aspartyl dipeptidase [Murinocardiopsis flavida]